MNEQTLVKTVNLPDGQDWAWYADANIVGLAPHLCPEDRQRALTEVQTYWRRSCLRVVPDGASSVTTQPMDRMTIRDYVEAL